MEVRGVYCTLLYKYTVNSIRYTVYSMQCTVYCILYTVYSVQYTVYSIQCLLHTVYSIQYTVYSIQCLVYSGHSDNNNPTPKVSPCCVLYAVSIPKDVSMWREMARAGKFCKVSLVYWSTLPYSANSKAGLETRAHTGMPENNECATTPSILKQGGLVDWIK